MKTNLTKKSLINLSLLLLMAIVVSIIVLTAVIQPNNEHTKGSGNTVLQTYDNAKNYVIAQCGANIRNYRITEAGWSARVDTYNYSQHSMNTNYNLQHPNATISGTCSEVAFTSLFNYYHRSGMAQGPSLVPRRIFEDVLECAIAVGATTGNNGTYAYLMDNLMSLYYDNIGAAFHGNIDYSGFFNTIFTYVNSSRPVVINNSDHTMVACGTTDIKAAYQKKNIFGLYVNKTIEVDFIIINDGWSNSTGYNDDTVSYIPRFDIESLIKAIAD